MSWPTLSETELAAAIVAFDIECVLAGSPARELLADAAQRAARGVAIALTDAPGRPNDPRWRDAMRMIAEFLCAFREAAGSERLDRLRRFIAENADLTGDG